MLQDLPFSGLLPRARVQVAKFSDAPGQTVREEASNPSRVQGSRFEFLGLGFVQDVGIEV